MEKFSPDGRFSFLGPGDEKKWPGTLSHKPDGKWNVTAEEMMIIFAESGHPVFICSSPFARGALKSEGGGRSAVHRNAEPSTATLLLRNTYRP